MIKLGNSKTSLDFNLIDLTHILAPTAPTWSGSCGFQHRIIVDYPEACRVQSIEMNAGTGTHLDAPLHFIPGAASAAELPLEECIAPLVVIDISAKAHADYYLSVEDIIAFEKRFGAIQPRSIVVAHTGWDRHWSNPEHYRNCDAQGQMHFPGFSPEAAELLLERQINGIGIDSLSPDCLDLSFPVHHLILGAGKYIAENLTHCQKLPPLGAYGLFLPIKTQEGTEAVMRAAALVPV